MNTFKTHTLLVEDIEDKLEILSNQFFINPKKILEISKKMDPTYPKCKYITWILRMIRDVIFMEEDAEDVKETLHNFDKYKHLLIKKDINQYKSLDEINRELHGKREYEAYNGTLPDGSKEVYNDNMYRVIKITKTDASMELCDNSEWCTKRHDPARRYTQEGPLYLITKKVSNKELNYVLFHKKSSQIKTVNDVKANPIVALEVLPLLIKSGAIQEPGIDSYDVSRETYYCKMDVERQSDGSNVERRRYLNGNIVYVNDNGKRHRLNGPAVIMPNGSKEYWKNGTQYTDKYFKNEISPWSSWLDDIVNRNEEIRIGAVQRINDRERAENLARERLRRQRFGRR